MAVWWAMISRQQAASARVRRDESAATRRQYARANTPRTRFCSSTAAAILDWYAAMFVYIPDGDAAATNKDTLLPVLCVSTNETVLDQRTPVVTPAPYDAEVDVLFRYVVRNVDTQVALAHASQVQRAVLRCVKQLFTTSTGQTTLVRNLVQLISVRAIRTQWSQPNDDSVVTCAVLVTVQVRDAWATS